MWRRIYLLLLAVRLYFALSPSYIHPDEHFQGPEVMAGTIFNWPTHKTWEFTAEAPIRSFFPLWLVYGLPMTFFHWISPAERAPITIFYMLRTLFFLSSFVLEDWALQELISLPRQRHLTLTLLASSYVTWTYQTHTFSNSIEVIAVLWSLVLIERIATSRSPAFLSPALLGFTAVFGLFNRITFPAFLLLPAYRVIPHILKHPLTLAPLIITAVITAALAINADSVQYSNGKGWVITPLNNLLYNSQTKNLAEHGLHPYYTHLLANLPQLLGPALVLLRRPLNTPVLSALGGLLALSLLPHQEARFLLPCVPLLLTSMALPRSTKLKRAWIVSWIIFNTVYGVLMGAYHQAGIVPAQAFLASTDVNITDVVYWKTYNPPTWLLGPRSATINTTTLMGAPVETLLATLNNKMDCSKELFLAAPLSATALDPLVEAKELEIVWSTRRHLNMDDLNFGEEGVVGTVKRVVGRRGLGVWRVKSRECP
ncbi:Alg9-like mannosyltransferase family-domain-containing protein [Sphaerosporella brunnea]|uniref:Mannosyltransferase n=1 Tax=Sphaerosporella brunnea TaxID=1250544 RepID=A0A5J5F428_9PEZI|nr:Alg9-like mannosyltransferase family-domain-containing protein [Sphaerosporella brunnea]